MKRHSTAYTLHLESLVPGEMLIKVTSYPSEWLLPKGQKISASEDVEKSTCTNDGNVNCCRQYEKVMKFLKKLKLKLLHNPAILTKLFTQRK